MAEENDAQENDAEAEMLRMMQEELGGETLRKTQKLHRTRVEMAEALPRLRQTQWLRWPHSKQILAQRPTWGKKPKGSAA